MEFTRTSRKIRAISMISLIDIIFTVILFFIVAGHMEKFSVIPVELPKADSGQRLDEGADCGAARPVRRGDYQ
jgi:biopolymer transport protein ExbD